MRRLGDIRPRCAVCDKPVEGFSHLRNDFEASDVYIAICHGAREEMTIPASFFFQDRDFDIVDFVAFQTKRIDEPVKKLEGENA